MYRKVSPEIFLLPCFRPKLQTCNPMNKWSCFQEHGTTWTKIHLISTDAMQAAKQLKPRGPVRHDFSETLGIGEGWLGLTAFSWAWRVASGLPCVSALAAAKDGQFEHVLELHAILQGKSLLLCDCDTQWNHQQCPSWLFTSSSQVGSTFYTLGSCQIKCVSCKATIYLGPCQLPTNTNSNTHLAVLGFALVYSGRLWY